MASPQVLKLYYLSACDQFECDFVLAKSARQARTLMVQMYGMDHEDIEECSLVKAVGHLLPAETEPRWIGPAGDVLEELGGECMRSVGSVKYRFGDRVFGCTQTLRERYEKDAKPDA